MTHFKIIILFIGTSIFSQSYQIAYEELYTYDYYELEDLKEELKKKETGFDSATASMLVCQNGKTSYGRDVTKIEKTIEEENSSSQMVSNEVTVVEYYKDKTANICIEFFRNYDPLLYGEDIIIEKELPIYKWTITDIEENISGYKCKLAKTTKNNGASIIAWFTDEIAISEGPRDYWGLPGLILQVQINDKVLIVATAIKKILDQKSIVFPTKGNKMTHKQFTELQKELFKPQKIVKPDGTIIIRE